MKLNKIDYESMLTSNKLLQSHPLFFNLMCMSLAITEIRVRHQCLVSAVGGRGGLMPRADFAFIERSWVRALARCFFHAPGHFSPKMPLSTQVYKWVVESKGCIVAETTYGLRVF